MKELWLFTIRYPYGTLESSLEHELPVLSRHFSKIVIFPLLPDTGIRPLPPNVEVRSVLHRPFHAAGPLTVLRHWRLWRMLWKEVFRSAPSGSVRRQYRWLTINKMRQALERTLVFQQAVGADYDPERVVLYSSWTLDWATILGLWKEVDPRVHFVTRMRGFDLYHHRVPGNWQVFQAFHVKRIGHLYTTCEAARAYITARYPELGPRTSISPTATDDHGQGPWSPSDVLRVVSCSNLLPIKRVHLIAEAIAGMDRPVHWTHFGDGPELKRIEQALAKAGPSIRATLEGRWSNADIIAWYRAHPVDLFVHVSSTEGGVSVALQEAVSFGIPVMGCDTGGVSEIANSRTGELLPWNISSDELRARMEHFALNVAGAERRSEIRSYWAERFHAAVVHERFALDLERR
jgi:glycosyltransferase involved in cell wall biosynthesis